MFSELARMTIFIVSCPLTAVTLLERDRPAFNLWRTESAVNVMNSIQNIERKFVFLVRSTFAEDTLTLCAL